MIVRSVTVGPVETNCYLFGDEAAGVGVIVDPGENPELIKKMIDDSGIRIEKILLTHGHFDHRDGVSGLKALIGEVPVYLQENDKAGEGKPVRYFYDGEVISYGEGDTISVGGAVLTVLETPGHTAGCVCLYTEGHLFAGDTLFAGTCGRCDLPSSSFEAMLRSLGRLSQLPEDTMVYPGHGHATTIGKEKKFNPYVRQAMGV